MRDPAGDILIGDTEIRRKLRSPIGKDHFLRSSLAKQWMEKGDLVQFSVVDEFTVVSQRIQFVSYPSEWCEEQLYQAGKLTLQLQKEAIESGFDLKDASAWNVVFDGGRPKFVDLLSLDKVDQKLWWAAGQYARHFILPMAASKYRGIRPNKVFISWRDGLPPSEARRLIGLRRLLTPFWPLMTTSVSPKKQEMSAVYGTKNNDVPLDKIINYRVNLNASLSWMLESLAPKKRRDSGGGNWQSYVEMRNHYSSDDMESKRAFVSEALNIIRPEWVLDLGCNSGEFTFLAAKSGARVIAVDSDHDAIERLVNNCSHDANIYAVLADIDDLSAGRGWCGNEFGGLLSRIQGRCDLVLMLALIHHLAIGNSIPLKNIAEFAAVCTKKWLLLELIQPDDPMVKMLSAQRRRNPLDLAIESQMAAFHRAGFCIRKSFKNRTGHRELVLFEKL